MAREWGSIGIAGHSGKLGGAPEDSVGREDGCGWDSSLYASCSAALMKVMGSGEVAG